MTVDLTSTESFEVMGLAGILPIDYTYLLPTRISLNAARDILRSPSKISSHPAAPGFDHEGYRRTGGGKVANISSYLSLNGHSVGICGAIGEDEAGQIILEEFDRYGVNRSWIKSKAKRVTRSVYILHKLDRRRSKQIHNGKGTPRFPKAIIKDLPESQIIIAGRGSQYVIDYVNRVRSSSSNNSGDLAFNVSSIPWRDKELSQFRKTISLANVVVIGDNTAAKLAGKNALDNPWHILDKLLEISQPQLAILYVGNNRVYARHCGIDISVEDGSYVDVLDPTGMSDCFYASLLSFLLHGSWRLDNADLVKAALRFANEMAGFCGTGIGARHFPVVNQSEYTRSRYWKDIEARGSYFISHSSKDAEYIGPLSRELNSEPGIKTWVNGVNAGDGIKYSIESAIEEADIFVLVISKNTIKSKWVKYEVEYAQQLQDRGLIKIIPILIEETYKEDKLKKFWADTSILLNLVKDNSSLSGIAYHDGRLSKTTLKEVVSILLEHLG